MKLLISLILLVSASLTNASELLSFTSGSFKLSKDSFLRMLSAYQAKDQSDQKALLKYDGKDCIANYHFKNEYVDEFSFECDGAITIEKKISPNSLWEKLPQLATKSSSITQNILIGNPTSGIRLYLNGEGNLISYHLGSPWKNKTPLMQFKNIIKNSRSDFKLIKKVP